MHHNWVLSQIRKASLIYNSHTSKTDRRNIVGDTEIHWSADLKVVQLTPGLLCRKIKQLMLLKTRLWY